MYVHSGQAKTSKFGLTVSAVNADWMLLADLVGQVFICSLDTARTRHQFRQIDPALDGVFAKASAQDLFGSLTVFARNVAARKGFEADAGRRYSCSMINLRPRLLDRKKQCGDWIQPVRNTPE